MGSCHACSGPHLVKDCEESICKKCKPNLDSHMPARCPRKRLQTNSKSQNLLILITALEISLIVTMTQTCNYPFQPVKPDHIAELLEATRKMTNYFKKSYEHYKSQHNSTDSHHPSTGHNKAIHSDEHKCKLHNTNGQVNEIIGQTHAPKNAKSEHEDIKDSHDSDSPGSNLDSSSHSK